MPKTQPKPVDTADPKSQPRSDMAFIRCELSEEQRRLLAVWSEELETVDLLAWIAAEVERGHVLSVRANEVGYQCSLTGVRESSGHDKQCLVGRASTPIRAIHAVMYRDVMVLSGIWPLANATSDLDF